jgi:hypothetical protein
LSALALFPPSFSGRANRGLLAEAPATEEAGASPATETQRTSALARKRVLTIQMNESTVRAGLGRSIAHHDEMTMYLKVQTVADVDRYMDQVRASARRAQTWVASQSGDPLDLLRRMKFEPVGCHPIEDRVLNIVEQINQTWTFAVALAAVRQLLTLHPDVGGFRLAPGAHASIPLDIMSEAEGLVGAETFATVSPRNNGKLAVDLAKLAQRPELHRYVFFMSPRYPKAQRLRQFERDSIQVWSVAL